MARTVSGRLLTELVLEIFRVNGLLLAAGDELTRPWGLSSARWKVLGAIALARRPLHVAQIARNMGITRQSVHRLVGDLAAQGLLQLVDNPDHKKASLLRLTPKGDRVYGELEEMQVAWVNELARRFRLANLESALGVLKELTETLDPRRGPRFPHGELRKRRRVVPTLPARRTGPS
jgi:DNA-binding MarR family transcriptional regulator